MANNLMDPLESAADKLDKQKRKKVVLFYILLTVLLLVIVVLALVIAGKMKQLAEERAQAAAAKRPAINVVVLETAQSLIKDRLNLPGVIEPWLDLELLAKIGGEVMEVLVEEGDRVAEGDVLARLDEADYRIAAEAATATHNQATADLKRTQALFAKGLSSEAELEESKTREKIAKAELDNAALQLSRCRVTAPIAGVVRRLDIKKGSIIQVSDPIGRLLQIDMVKAVVGIPESDVVAVRDIREVPLTIQALDNLEVVGRYHFLAQSPENMARLYQLELAVNNPEQTILPGMFVRAEIVKRQEQGVAVPLYAVISRDNNKFVYVEEAGKARRRDVVLGILQEWMVEVDGVQPGERVIVEGHRNVEDGQDVNVVRVLKDGQGSLP